MATARSRVWRRWGALRLREQQPRSSAAGSSVCHQLLGAPSRFFGNSSLQLLCRPVLEDNLYVLGGGGHQVSAHRGHHTAERNGLGRSLCQSLQFSQTGVADAMDRVRKNSPDRTWPTGWEERVLAGRCLEPPLGAMVERKTGGREQGDRKGSESRTWKHHTQLH